MKIDLQNRNCIFCNAPLEGDMLTDEHIIPRCMGGNIWSKNLICRDCNSKFGTEFDEALIKRFYSIILPLSIYNEDIKIKDVEVEFKGIKYLLTKEGIRLKNPRPIIDENGSRKGMIYPSEERHRIDLERKKRKDPTIDVQKTLDLSESNITDIFGPFKVTIKEVGEDAYRCIGKICYEFLNIFNENYQPSNDKFKQFVLGTLELKNYPICPWYVDYKPFQMDIEKIYNFIVIEGRCEENILLAYSQFYSCLKTILIIDENYNGNSFCKGYYHEINENIKDFFTPTEIIPLSKQEVKNLIINCNISEMQQKTLKNILNAVNLARIYPLKISLKTIREKISLMEEPHIVDNRNMILENLEETFQKYGLSDLISTQIENINETYKNDIILEKIWIHLSYLMEYFRRSEVHFEIISDIVKTF